MQFSEELSTIFGHETREFALIAENKQHDTHQLAISSHPSARFARFQNSFGFSVRDVEAVPGAPVTR